MSSGPRQGFLILADLTGFTPFVASTELDHSQEILRNILNSIVSDLTPAFTLAEVEGDAVFVYSPKEKFSSGETIIEMIEACFYSFRDRKNSFDRIRTCNCKACRMVPLLDLKFIIHFGEYILNNLGGKIKPMGTSVNVAHRLLKNRIGETTGWRAYALFTEACINTIGINLCDAHMQTEMHEHIGSINTFSIDLDKQYIKFASGRKVYLSEENSDLVIQKDFSVPPPLLWEWLNEPQKRSHWEEGSDWRSLKKPEGRRGKGAVNHCANSKIKESILDYKPFDYYTSKMTLGPLSFTATSKLEEIPSGTRLYCYLRINGFLPKWVSQPLSKIIFEKIFKTSSAFEKLSHLVESRELDNEVISVR